MPGTKAIDAAVPGTGDIRSSRSFLLPLLLFI